MLRTLTFVETVAGVTYTARTSIPPGARLMDIIIETTTAWTAATAPCDVGDSDASDALLNNVDLAAQQGTTAGFRGGTDWGNGLDDNSGPYGTDIGSNGISGPGKLYPNGDIITAVVSPTVPGGPTGVSKLTLWLEVPTSNRNAVVV